MSAAKKQPAGKAKAPAIKDAPGELVWVAKEDLSVDHSFQRNHSPDRVARMAASWSWIACGVLVVAWRKDNTWSVIDGQHRWMAAMLLNNVEELPCIMFEELEVAAEARAFTTTNVSRRPLHAAEIHRARVVSGDRLSILIDKMVTDSGRTVANYSSPSTVACVSTLLELAKDDERVLTALWPVIVHAAKGHAISNRIVGGIYYLETKMLKGTSLTEPRWKKRLAEVGVPVINDAINRFSAAYARGGSRVWAMGVREAIDHGLRNRLSIKDEYATAGSL